MAGAMQVADGSVEVAGAPLVLIHEGVADSRMFDDQFAALGSGDIPDILDQADLLARSIPGARKLVIRRLAHVLNMERPREINQIVLDFLGEVYASATVQR